MHNKFTEEFERASGGAFPMLKFRSALYQKDTGILTVRFLISAYDARAFLRMTRELSVTTRKRKWTKSFPRYSREWTCTPNT